MGLESFRNLMELSPGAVFIAAHETGRILEVNDRACELLDYSKDELLGMVISSFDRALPNDLPPRHRAKALEREKWLDFESRYYRKDGVAISVAANARYTIVGGKNYAVITACAISDREQVAEWVKPSACQQAVDNASDAIVILDENFEPIYTNEAFKSLFDARSDLYSKYFPIGLWRRAIETVYEEGKWSAEFDVTQKNGHIVPVYAKASKIASARGKIAGVVGLFIDISERRRAEEAEKMFRQIQKRETIGTLASGIAHDFNNVLQRVVGFADLLKGRFKEGSKELRYADIIKATGIHGAEVVKGILAFSGQRRNASKKAVDVKRAVEESLIMLQHALPSTIRIEKCFSPELCAVDAEASSIQQVVTNLCINAAHAMPLGGVLKIGIGHHESCQYRGDDSVTCAGGNQCDISCPLIYISIADSGEGISESIRDHVFDPFFTTKAPHEGTGLGLSVVHGIVKEIGGCLSFKSNHGAGTIFTVCLPDSGTQVEPETKLIQTTLPLGGKRILVVDDDEFIVEFMAIAMTQLGYDVKCCCGSHEALDIFMGAPDMYDIIITDLTMPGLTGTELAGRIKTVRPDIQIILCTGYRSKVTQEEIIEAGIAEVMIKPISAAELSFAIGRLSGCADRNKKGGARL